MIDPFDPFDLPSSFDPLASDAPPPPPRRRRAGGAAEPDRAKDPATGAGAGGRLAHLLHPPRPPGDDGTARLAALEAQVAALTARLAALEAQIRAVTDALAAGAHAVSGKRGSGKHPRRKTSLPPFLR